VLKSCFDDGARVCVTLRRIDGIRGKIRGYLKAFDKHMNMVRVMDGSACDVPDGCEGVQVLIDADESFIPATAPKHHYPRRCQHRCVAS